MRAPCARLRLRQLIADDPVEADIGLGRPDGQAAMKLRGDSHLESTGVPAVGDRDGRALAGRFIPISFLIYSGRFKIRGLSYCQCKHVDTLFRVNIRSSVGNKLS